ncbi:MAG: FadR/GntR family transcriptional regulator [Egibacteraceae bacterium]
MRDDSNQPVEEALRPLSRTRLYEQLVRRLLDHVLQVGMEPGQRLPPERVLAERLGVSRASVRQAITALEVQGVVDVRHGDGTYLRRSGATGETLTQLIERRRRLPDIMETREALEVKLAELAAVRRTDEDLAKIDAALEVMADDIAQGGNGAAADAAFHRAVTLAAHNDIMSELMNRLADPIKESRMASLEQPGRPPKSLAGHRLIAEAIRREDLAGAAAAMRDHLVLVADVEGL